jgi:RNA polymerase sigma-70 factor, ECF subfamily
VKSVTAIGTVSPGALAPKSTATLAKRFELLLAVHGAALRRLAASYTKTAADRDDLLQDIFMALWLALPRFRGECSERTFVFRIAHNRGITHFSRKRPTLPMNDEDVEAQPAADTLESTLSQEQRWNSLLRAVHGLPIIYRQVIVLALEGLEYTEIAEVLGVSDNNVAVRANRARQLLRQLLEDER